jgi:hypothetical protein
MGIMRKGLGCATFGALALMSGTAHAEGPTVQGPTAVAPTTQQSKVPAPPRPSARVEQRLMPWIVTGVGLGLLAGAGAAGALLLHEKAVNDAGCSDATRTCAPDARDAAQIGRILGPVTTAALVLGGTAVAVGGVWLGIEARSGQGTIRVGGSW